RSSDLDGADDLAAAAAHAGAAQGHGGDGVQLIAVAQGGLGRVDTGNHDKARQGGEEAGNAVDNDLHLVGVDAHQLGALGVGAGGVDPAAEGGAVEDEVEDHKDQDQNQGRDGEADGGVAGEGQIALAHGLEEEGAAFAADALGQPGDGLAVGEDHSQAAVGGHGNQRGDEGLKPALGDQDAADAAQDHAGDQGQQHGQHGRQARHDQ